MATEEGDMVEANAAGLVFALHTLTAPESQAKANSGLEDTEHIIQESDLLKDSAILMVTRCR